jgi:hypothetical protein
MQATVAITSVLSNFKLPFSFDAKGLQSDLEQIAIADWPLHFNRGYFQGAWTGVALRSCNGLPTQLYSDPTITGPFADTPVFAACPNARAALTVFQCPLLSVRFLRLSAGSVIREHRDYDLGFDLGQVRFHIPVFTNSDVDFFLDAHKVEMKEGECWYLDLGLPHWVKNRGATDRIHLVIDCEVNEWLSDLLASMSRLYEPETTSTIEPSPSLRDLERFRHAVLNDLALQQRLRMTEDTESFIRLVVSVGREHGFWFTAAHAAVALQTARLCWSERWKD